MLSSTFKNKLKNAKFDVDFIENELRLIKYDKTAYQNLRAEEELLTKIKPLARRLSTYLDPFRHNSRINDLISKQHNYVMCELMDFRKHPHQTKPSKELSGVAIVALVDYFRKEYKARSVKNYREKALDIVEQLLTAIGHHKDSLIDIYNEVRRKHVIRK